MKKLSLIFLITIVFFCSTVGCSQKEKADHICFKTIDSNKDGMVDFQEFQKHYGENTTKFKSIDLNNDGKLNHEEYHKFLGHGS